MMNSFRPTLIFIALFGWVVTVGQAAVVIGPRMSALESLKEQAPESSQQTPVETPQASVAFTSDEEDYSKVFVDWDAAKRAFFSDEAIKPTAEKLLGDWGRVGVVWKDSTYRRFNPRGINFTDLRFKSLENKLSLAGIGAASGNEFSSSVRSDGNSADFSIRRSSNYYRFPPGGGTLTFPRDSLVHSGYYECRMFRQMLLCRVKGYYPTVTPYRLFGVGKILYRPTQVYFDRFEGFLRTQPAPESQR